MKGLVIGWGVAALFVVSLKLFTYEFYLRDDPTTGIALRFPPAWVSHQVLVDSPSGTDVILLQDENVFVGNTLYRALVQWVWIALLAGWLVLVGIAYRSNPARRGQGTGDGKW
jgi:hypothetical protein